MTEIETAVFAAKKAGKILRENFHAPKNVDEATHHDLKLALDRETQDLISEIILENFPNHAIYGEEGLAGDQSSSHQWIVDPIDGTVNFFYCIPHFCVSIAKRIKDDLQLGVIYDPMVDELWTVEKGQLPKLNGAEISVSQRKNLEESILFVGCGKDEEALQTGLVRFKNASLRARKMRMMGSAALGMAYIACGRLDAYVESRISLWDIAAGQLMIEATGGKVTLTPNPNNPDVYSIVASNGKIPINEIL